jgi:hypothetical protein
MFRILRHAALIVLIGSLACVEARACAGRLHIELTESGVYALDYAAIVAAEPRLADCRADDLVLWHDGREVPIRLVGDAAGFGPGSRIEWLGEMRHGPQSWFDQYSAANVYQLAAAPGTHARMRMVEAPATAGARAPLVRKVHFEQENLLIRLSDTEMKPGDEPDVWQWAKLTPIDPAPFAFRFDLADLAAGRGAADATLTLDFRGESNVIPAPNAAKAIDHVVAVSLNGHALRTLAWDGRSERRETFVVPGAWLKDQGNTLTLRVPRRDLPDAGNNFIVDVVMFNWLELAYPLGGDLDAGASAFAAAGAGSIEFGHAGADLPELYGSDGSVRAAHALGNGRFRAAPAPENVDLYPRLDGRVLRPTRVRAVAERDPRAADPGFDYLIVAHPRLRAAIEPLAQYHRAHGLRVAVYDVEELYDAFSGGLVHPRAIRDLVAWGAAHWTIKPRYLLLVGDASFDIHHDLRTNRPHARQYAIRPQPFREEMLVPGGLSALGTTPYAQWDPELPNRNLIPTWQVPTAGGQSASDNPFVALKPGDFHPQLAVGRLPVVEPDEVKAIVDKTIAYLEHPEPGAWRRDITFVSTSELAAFKQESDRLAAELRARGFAIRSLYTDFNEKDPARYRQARAELKRDLDDGNLIVHFLGHGGQFIWRVGPIGDLFSLDDVAALSNTGRYPMVLAMTCFSAPFDHPTEDSIGERFLREPDKGAVAVFAASWTNWPNPAYSKPLIDRLLTPGTPIGEAIVASKAHIDDRVFVETYNLLGDPALVLARPEAQLRFARGGDRWNPQVLVRVPAGDFGGEVAVDWLDAEGRVLSSRWYQARDAQFALAVPAGAARVSVYAQDGRNGRSAMGGFDLGEPAQPVATVPPPAPPATARPAAASIVPTAAPIAAPRPAANVRDRLGAHDFERRP